MGFRADITPQVARIDAHTLRREGPSRLCYAGSVLHAQPRALSSSRSPIQLGAELYGDASPSSDVEVISLMLAMLQLADVPDVHMDLGHVGIYRGLARAAGLSGEVEQQLFDALQRKAIDEVSLTEGLPADLSGMLRALVDLCGGREVLAAARERLANAPAPVLAALEDLLAIAERLARVSRSCRCTSTWASCAATTTTPVWCSPCSCRALVSPSPRAVVTTTSAPTSVGPVRPPVSPPI
jgi:ATP phosphoribosyltransferase regulatory subunit